MSTWKQYLAVVLFFVAQHVGAQTVTPITSNFDDYFKGEAKSNFALLKNYMDTKDNDRQDIMADIEDMNAKIKALNIDTVITTRVENAIQSVMAQYPANNGIFPAHELRPSIISMAQRFGRGTLPGKSAGDTSYRYNLNFLKDDLASAEATYKNYMSSLEILNHNLRVVNSDRQRVEYLIQNVYTVEKGNQEFKTRISLYFAAIIGVLLIVFFLFIYLKSEHGVANEFLSGNGIQFVALFSLINAVVLFGILGVLEGRELAAILSGISGFILGKGITKTDKQQPRPAVEKKNAHQSAAEAAPLPVQADAPPSQN
jgi:hypothetical protein